MKIILREWNPYIRYDLEFRCFVYDNNLTAISQYDFSLHSEIIKNNHNLIKESILKYFNDKIKNSLINFKNYVIDIAILDREEFSTLKVIELNPFNTEEFSGIH
jgi:hypothetical protein